MWIGIDFSVRCFYGYWHFANVTWNCHTCCLLINVIHDHHAFSLAEQCGSVVTCPVNDDRRRNNVCIVSMREIYFTIYTLKLGGLTPTFSYGSREKIPPMRSNGSRRGCWIQAFKEIGSRFGRATVCLNWLLQNGDSNRNDKKNHHSMCLL